MDEILNQSHRLTHVEKIRVRVFPKKLKFFVLVLCNTSVYSVNAYVLYLIG